MGGDMSQPTGTRVAPSPSWQRPRSPAAPRRAWSRRSPPEEAANLNTSFLRDVADNLIGASALANIAGFMAYAPAGSASFFRDILPERIGLLETVAPSFGDCLFHAATTLLDAGHDAVCLLNSDSPTLPTAYLTAAATALAAPGDRIVLGPSTDGGYYLLGLKQPHRRLFEDIDWSTERVAAQTLGARARARPPGAPAALLVRRRRPRRAAPAGAASCSRSAASASGEAGRRPPPGRGASSAGCSTPPTSPPGSPSPCPSSLVA